MSEQQERQQLISSVICRRCGKATRNRSHYCDDCEPYAREKQMRWKEYQEKQKQELKGKARLYHTSFWQKLRKQVLNRDNWLCRECARNGRISAASQVDHIIPLAKGGDNSLGNLQSLCKKCHALKTAREDSKN